MRMLQYQSKVIKDIGELKESGINSVSVRAKVVFFFYQTLFITELLCPYLDHAKLDGVN